MKLFYLRRETTVGEESNVKLGKIQTKTTNIKKYLLGLPIQTLRTYKEAYYGDKGYKDSHMFI